MNLSAIITQLRTYCPALSFVGGSADFAVGLETVVNPIYLPAAYVVPLADDAEPNASMNALSQTVYEHVGIICQIDNSADRRGQASSNQIDVLRSAIFAAILNWQPDTDHQPRGLEYVASRFIEMDRGRLWWEFDFVVETQISEIDGWQPTSDDLVEIEVDVQVNPAQPTPPDPPVPPEVDIFLFPPGKPPLPTGVEATGGVGILTTTTSS